MGLFSKSPDYRTKEEIAREHFANAYGVVNNGRHFEYNMFHAHYVEIEMLDKLYSKILELEEEIEELKAKLGR